MFSHGLKDAHGSPLLSQSVGDARYGRLTAENEFTALNTFHNAYIKSLTVDQIIINDETVAPVSAYSYEENTSTSLELNFSDENNDKYVLADETNLSTEEDCKTLTITFSVPESLGTKLVKRPLVIDLRTLDSDVPVVTVYPDDSQTTWKLHWESSAPLLEAGCFYVLSFQRLANDLIYGKVEVKI